MARPYLAVVGNIGSGKTSLANIIASTLDWCLIAEPIQENPYFVGDTYRALEDIAFRLQVYYLGFRAQQHLKALECAGPAIQDRTIYEDSEVFSETYFERGAYSLPDIENLRRLYAVLARVLPVPDLFIYTYAPINVLQQHILGRNRSFEKSLDEALLIHLQRNYERWIQRQSVAPVLKIDTSKINYVDDDAAKQYVINIIIERINELNLW